MKNGTDRPQREKDKAAKMGRREKEKKRKRKNMCPVKFLMEENEAWIHKQQEQRQVNTLKI